MAAQEWTNLGSKYCGLIQMDIKLEEKRVYPSARLPDTERFRVVNRRCSAEVACNLAGVPCKWAFTNPSTDQFELQ